MTLLFIGFIVYASWTPSHVPRAKEGLWQALTNFGDMFKYFDLRDFATNILLYIPLGVLVALALPSKRLRLFTVWLGFGSAVSLLMEMGQWNIGRTPDPLDLFTNTTGFVLGFVLIFVSVKRYGLQAASLVGFSSDVKSQRMQTVAAFRFIATSLFLMVALLPLDITVKLSEIYAQLKSQAGEVPRIVLDPFYSFKHWNTRGLKLTAELAALLPIGALNALLDKHRGRANVSKSILTLVALVFVSEIFQLFIFSRRSDMASIVVAVVASLISHFFVAKWLHTESSGTQNEQRKVNSMDLLLLTLGYVLVLCIFAWSPFDFEFDLKTVLRKIRHDTNIIPFKLHFSARSLGSAVDIVKEFSLYIPLGVFMARALSSFKPLANSTKTFWLFFFGGSIALVLEISQAICKGRFIDITDVILATAGCVAGGILASVLLIGKSSPPESEHI